MTLARYPPGSFEAIQAARRERELNTPGSPARIEAQRRARELNTPGSYARIEAQKREIELRTPGSPVRLQALDEDRELCRPGVGNHRILAARLFDLYNTKTPEERKLFLQRIGITAEVDTRYPIPHVTAPAIEEVLDAYLNHLE